MANYITVIPAYGRDYTSQAKVKADWNAGADFQIVDYGPNDGKYINNSDIEFGKPITVLVRYSKLTKIVQVTK